MKITISLPKIIALFSVVGFLVYSKALFNEFVWDSIPQIVNNPSVTGFDIKRLLTSSASFPQTIHVISAYYKPVMYLMFAGLYALWGANTVPYHVLQLIVHIANAVMVFYVIRRFASANRSLFLSLIFLVHPINFEAAGYVSAFQDTLFLFWGLMAFHIVIAKRSFPGVFNYFSVGILLLLSLLSKETGIACMGVIVLYSLMFGKKKQFILYSITSAIILALYFALRIIASHDVYGYLLTSYSMTLPLPYHLLSLPAILSYYFTTFFFPVNLHIDHQWAVKSLTWRGFFLPLTFLLSMAGLFFYMIRKKSLKVGRKNICFFALWLVGGLAIHSNVLAPLDMTVADRWFYFPSIGFLALIAIMAPKPGKKTIYALYIFLILISFQTYVRSYDWSDKLTLYGNDLNKDPDNYYLANKYAAALLDDEMYNEAEPVLLKAYSINPQFSPVISNLGHLYVKKGQFDKGYEYFHRAALMPANADKSIAYAGMIHVMYDLKKDMKTANKLTRIAAAQFPSVYQFQIDLAVTDYKLGNTKEAIEILAKLFKKTNNSDVYRLIVRMQKGDILE